MSNVIDFNSGVGLQPTANEYSDEIRKVAAFYLLHDNDVNPDQLSTETVTAYLQGCEAVLVKLSDWLNEKMSYCRPPPYEWFAALDDNGDLEIGFIEVTEVDPEEDEV